MTDSRKPEPFVPQRTGQQPPGGGKQDHAAMRADAMIPVAGPAGTDTLASGGGLDVPGREPTSSVAQLADLDPVSASPELIPGAYEPDTATHREPGAIGGRFNGQDAASAASETLLDDAEREERRRFGGGGRHDRKTKAND